MSILPPASQCKITSNLLPQILNATQICLDWILGRYYIITLTLTTSGVPSPKRVNSKVTMIESMENARKSCRQRTGRRDRRRVSKVSNIALNLHIYALPSYLLSWTQDTACSTSLQERFPARSCNPDKASCHALWARCAAAWLEAAAAVMARVVAEHRESQSTEIQPRDEEPNRKRVFHRMN